ncbi:MAG: TRAP transporter small permease, partial [Limnochordia bacterium]
ARFLFFWTALTGASISVKNQRHFVIEVFSVDKIKNPLGKRLMMVLPHLLILSFALIMAVYGYQYALSGRFRIGPTSRLPMFYVFMATPVAGVTMVIYTVYNLLRLLVDEADKVTDNASRNSQTG